MTVAFGVSAFGLEIAGFRDPEGYCSLAIIAFGAFGFIVPNTIVAWENGI